MSEKEFNLEEYLSNGVEKIVKNAIKASFSNPKESVFMAKFALETHKAAKRRKEAEQGGEHIPLFLVASVTSSCNLHCAGCYAREVDSCSDCEPVRQLGGEAWGKIFREAAELGISFVIFVGGEPLMRRDVIEQAAGIPEILFPVITNGIMLKGDYLDIFEKNRNLIPVISIEGNEQTTDKRRGAGVYKAIDNVMASLKDGGIIYGVSITVTTENMDEVFSQDFVDGLRAKGCQLILYVEYVPAEEDTRHLAPSDAERMIMEESMARLRSAYEDVVFLAFPGDEKSSGGCLAAGRGFFHINSHGGAEPCPFSTYSDCSVAELGIKGALHSALFEKLQASDMLTQDHEGGCTLFRQKDKVEALL